MYTITTDYREVTELLKNPKAKLMGWPSTLKIEDNKFVVFLPKELH
jgi:beta-galactosidase beta subunit